MESNNEVWKTEECSEKFLKNIRDCIPLALEQIDTVLRVIQGVAPKVGNFLDLGCGDGVLGDAILTKYPESRGVFLDISQPMLQNARKRLGSNKKLEFIIQDFGNSKWVGSVKSNAPFDVVVSGLAIHHQPDARKKGIYKEIYELLVPGGLFLNLEHVAPKSQWVRKAYEDLFIDSLYSFSKKNNTNKSRERIAEEFHDRTSKGVNILAPLETQCNWLEELGFIDVDCFMKIFELTLFGGIKPKRYQ